MGSPQPRPSSPSGASPAATPSDCAEPALRDVTEASLQAIYHWSYDPEIDQLRNLYAKALDNQWIGLRDLDWERGIDREAFARTFSVGGFPLQRTRFWQQLEPELQWEVSRRTSGVMLSNFLHGEQGALMVAAQMVNAVPHMDGKFYAATQTLDEARHVEVFSEYIRLLDEVRPIAPGLKQVLDATIGHPAWTFKAVGMQIVLEGLALYSFRDMRNATEEPLLKQLLSYVSRDEARHTAYGVRYLSHVVGELGPGEIAELEDFAFEATRLILDVRVGTPIRKTLLAVWREVGMDPAQVLAAIAEDRPRLERELAASGGDVGPVRGFVIPTLRALGLFSERIEGHFRDMFSANFGSDRALRLDLERELPTDLDAWVEQGGA